MALFFIILICSESLPPIPDLSQVLFPEPQLWSPAPQRYLGINAYGGQYFGGDIGLSLNNFDLSLQCDMREDWDSIITAKGGLSYFVSFPGFFLVPEVSGFYHRINDEYIFLKPGIRTTIELPKAYLLSDINGQIWQINTINYQEYSASIDLIFDRVIYTPHFSITGIYSGQKIEPVISSKLHINRIHLSVGSLLSRSFPSPIFHIQYMKPNMRIGAEFRSGAVPKTLEQDFDFTLPLEYRISIPTESLKTSIKLDCRLDLHDHGIMWGITYNSWYEKLVPSQGFVITSMENIEEIRCCFSLNNRFAAGNMSVRNSLHIAYTWFDSTIALIPRHAIYDTLTIELGPIELSAETKQYSTRSGTIYNLPALFVLTPALRLHYKQLSVFGLVNNVTDERSEIFDGYFLKGRQYAAGLSFEYYF
jgi:hypothetical protein